MDQTLPSSPPSPITILPQVCTLYSPYHWILSLLSLSQASPLSSPQQLIRRLPRTRSRTHLNSRASLESIIEETSTDGFEFAPTPTPAMSNPPPDSKHEQEHIRGNVTQPQGWNGKKGITTSRAMRDVCGIWYVGLFGSGAVPTISMVTLLFGTALSRL
jgi:hypothetical protein